MSAAAKLTPAQVLILIEAAAYYETVLEDEERRRDIEVLNRATDALSGLLPRWVRS